MSGFKFVRKKNKFYWQNQMYRIEFSNPSGQAFDDYGTIKSVDDIMYFYYTMKVYRKAYNYIEKKTPNGVEEIENEYWKLIGSTHTHDFPCVQQLEQIITLLLDADTSKDGEKHEYRSGTIVYSKHYWTEGFGCDDFYELTKFTNQTTKESYYVLYVGVSSDPMGSIESEGVRIPYLSEHDIKKLLNCIREFFKYVVYRHNTLIKRNIEQSKEEYEIVENKLYQYYIENYRTLNKNRLDHIYAIGDELDDLYEYVYNDDGSISSKQHHSCFIREFKYNKIVCENKYNYYDGEELPKFFEVDVDNIAYICNEVTDEMLKYNQEQVAKEFYSVLSNIEKLDFMVLSRDELLSKYKEVIIGRTWLCRDEHNFNEKYSSYRRELDDQGINHIVYEIIDLVKTYDLSLKE